MSSIMAMKHFQNVIPIGMTGEKVSLATAIYTVYVSLWPIPKKAVADNDGFSGNMVATPVSAVLSDRLGRRKCMFVGGWVIIIGAIIATTTNGIPQFIVGRFVLGMGIQIMVVSAPAYAVEISPPHWRGRAVGEFALSSAGIFCLYKSQVSTTVVGSEALSPRLLSPMEPTLSTTTIHGRSHSSASALHLLLLLFLSGSFPSLHVGSSPTAKMSRLLLSWPNITAMVTPTLVSSDWRSKKCAKVSGLMVLTRSGGIVSSYCSLSTFTSDKHYRPSLLYDAQRPLAFLAGHHDLYLWTVVRQWSRLLQLDYF